jgi:hypothetical protein
MSSEEARVVRQEISQKEYREVFVYAGKFDIDGERLRFQAFEDPQWLGGLRSHLLVGLSFSLEQAARGKAFIQELLTVLNKQKHAVQVELVALHPGVRNVDFGPVTWRNLDTTIGLQIYSNFVGGMLTVPDALLEDVSIVTLCEAHITPEFGVHGPYLAQGEWLSRMDGPLHRYYGVELAYEAHRLIGNDLCLTFGDDYWLAGRCAPALEAALARAAGLPPNRLPQINYLQQREQIDLTSITTQGEFPSLAIPKTTVFRRGGIKLSHRVGRMLYRLQEDFALARQNLYRIKPFLQSRLGSR